MLFFFNFNKIAHYMYVVIDGGFNYDVFFTGIIILKFESNNYI